MKLDEIPRLAGVSRTTASYVFNAKAKEFRVSDKTVEKVMAVVRVPNYDPNPLAAGVRGGRTPSIC
uniref:LacI family DNA-binding transcriptional regulator n=1 Tax=Escherichia coli TaxID=562 RepID=UPI002FF0B7C0